MISKSAYLKFAPRIFFKKGLPVQLIFFVTSSCNLRCNHCFYWKELNEKKKEELTLSEIKKIASKSKLDLLWLSLTGGEPFLRPDLAEIAKAFYQSGKVVNLSIPSNGQLKDQTFEITNKILKYCPDSYVLLSISLEGPEKIHDKIRGCQGAFDKAVSTFDHLKKLKKFLNFGLSIQTTVSAWNQEKVKDLYFFIRDELHPDYFNFNLIRGEPRDKSLKEVNIKFYDELFSLVKEDVEKGKWPYFSFPLSKLVLLKNFEVCREISKIYKKNHFFSPCYSMDLSGVINEKGDVYPCELLPDSKIGNLRKVDYNLSKLWFSSQADKIRGIVKNKCFCTYECALSVNKLFNPKFYFKNLSQFF